MFDHRYVAEMDYDDGHSQIPSIDNPRLTKINAMRRGIMFADAINTVSPNYTREILTKEYGELLDELLRERRGVMMGILNGIDYEYWIPQTDSYILHQYNASNIKIRLNNKKVLQERFSLPIDENVFVLGIVSRLTKQKGFDLLFPIISILIQELPIQLIVLGEGESEVMGFFHDLETRYPKKVACHLKFDEALPHIVYAGADAVLIPSKFEPCGLVQMEAMRMGAVPIVRKTGGLADSVTDYDPQNQTGTGFTFENYDSYSLMIVIIRAYENYRDTKKWRGLQKRAMNENFSWESSAEKYIDFFNRAIEFNNLSKRISK